MRSSTSTDLMSVNLYPRELKEMFIWDAILTVALGLIYVILQ